MGFCNCSLFCCALLYVHSSFAIIVSHDCCVALPHEATGLSAFLNFNREVKKNVYFIRGFAKH